MKETKDKEQKADKLSCEQFCQLSKLDKSAKNYLRRKYAGKTLAKTSWDNIVKKDRVVY